MNKVSSYGTSLIEMAIVLVIIGLLISSILTPSLEQTTQQKIRETQQLLEEIKEALLGFAVVNGRLPCPATDIQGKEPGFKDKAQRTCKVYDNGDGYLPWAVLGVKQYDAWGRPFRYRVDGWYNNNIDGKDNDGDGKSDGGIFNPREKGYEFDHPIGATKAALTVYNRNGIALNRATSSSPQDVKKVLLTNQNRESITSLDYHYVSTVVAIIFSCGKNGRPDDRNDADGSINSDALCTNAGAEKPDWTKPKNDYVHDRYIADQFDDIVTWLPMSILVSRLTAAGKWPPFPIID